MNRTEPDWVGRTLLVICVCCIGKVFVRVFGQHPKPDSVQWKIDRLKEKIQKNAKKRDAEAAIVLRIPRDTEGSMMRCLLTGSASPIRWVSFDQGEVRADLCSMELGTGAYTRFWCPKSARKVAEACANPKR